jgi:hypothetical protein
MLLEKYSFGTGDRFGRAGEAQLAAIMEMNRLGVPVVPVWNKSHREHSLIGSAPDATAAAAADAVAAAGYKGKYYIDADHVSFTTMDRFIPHCNFFTLDVAKYIGVEAEETGIREFQHLMRHYKGDFKLPVTGDVFRVTDEYLHGLARKYMKAMSEVGKMFRFLCQVKDVGRFVTEVSVDESEEVQGPVDLFFILAMLRMYDVDVQNLAPRFPGLFAKGIDYIGDRDTFALAFEQDVAIVQLARQEFRLPCSLKLSVHSGSDKFSLYPVIGDIIRKYDAGLHLKTAGTTWLEEVAGLAEAGGEALEMTKEIYCKSLERTVELAEPYAGLLHFEPELLPTAAEVMKWTSEQFTGAITHDASNPAYNLNFRQLIHIGYRIAAAMGDDFLLALDRNRKVVAERVTFNLLERHMKPLFLEKN